MRDYIIETINHIADNVNITEIILAVLAILFVFVLSVENISRKVNETKCVNSTCSTENLTPVYLYNKCLCIEQIKIE